MRSYKQKAEDKVVMNSVIKKKSTEDLLACRDFLTKFLEFRKVNKLNSDYIQGTKKCVDYNEDSRVFFDFRFEGTVTGRLSCAAANDRVGKMGVSLHTLASEDQYNIRTMYCAEEGDLFITADFSTMELRVLALIANEEGMLRAFSERRDLHTYTASVLFGVEESEVSKAQRTVAKTSNFLIVYGGGPYNLSMTAGISLQEAKEVFSIYEHRFPRVFQYMREVEAQIYRDKYTSTIFGRRRNLPNIDSPNEKVREKAIRQGVNFTIQSPASDILLFSLEGCGRDLRAFGFSDQQIDGIFKGAVHDSIELSIPKEHWVEISEILYRNMVINPYLRESFPQIDFSVPFEVDMEIGKSFGEGFGVEFDEDSGKVINIEEVENYLKEKNLL